MNVKSRSTLSLSSGKYYVRDLTLEPQSHLKLLEISGRVELYVRGTITFRGDIVTANGNFPDWFVGYLGTSRVSLEGSFRGTLFAPNADVTLAWVPSLQHEGAFFGKNIEVTPGIKVVFHPSSFLIDQLIPGSTTTFPSVPNYHSTFVGCQSALKLEGGTQVGPNDFRYRGVSKIAPTPGCDAVRFCRDGGDGAEIPFGEIEAKVTAKPTGDVTCKPFGTIAECPLLPDSVGGLCNSDVDCAAGMTCAKHCTTTSCETTELRCAARLDCRSIAAETLLPCDNDYIYECTPPEGKGATDHAYVASRLPNSSSPGPDATVPPEKQAAVQPYRAASATDFCGCTAGRGFDTGAVKQGDFYDPVAGGKDEESSGAVIGGQAPTPVDRASAAKLKIGNDTFGLFVDPLIYHKAKVKADRIDDFSVDVKAQGSLIAGAKVFGKVITGVDLDAHAFLTNCQIDTKAAFKLFGETVASAPAVHTPDSLAASCDLAAKTLKQASQTLENVMVTARQARQHFTTFGADKSMCQYVMAHYSVQSPPDCNDPVSITAHSRQIINIIRQDYNNFGINEFRLARAKAYTQLVKLNTHGRKKVDLDALSLGEPFELLGASKLIPIGPISIEIAASLYGDWGLAGGLEYELSVGEDGGPPGFSVVERPVGDPKIGGGAYINPHLNLDASVYAGVGIGGDFLGVSIGLEAQIRLVHIGLPVGVDMLVQRATENDGRNLAASDYAGTLIPAMATSEAYHWTGKWKFHADAELGTLSGQVNAAARVHFFFYSKTFRKKIADWAGISETFPIASIGGDVPFDFGRFADIFAYTELPSLDGVEPSAPDATKAFGGNFVGDACAACVK